MKKCKKFPVRWILIRDIIGTASKFILGCILVSIGLGAFGILLSFLFYSLVITLATLTLALKRFGITKYNDYLGT